MPAENWGVDHHAADYDSDIGPDGWELPGRLPYKDGEWQPGDPLYVHPFHDVADRQVVRWVFQVIDDDESHWWKWMESLQWHCYECYVGWEAQAMGDRFCWSCGREGYAPGQKRDEAA